MGAPIVKKAQCYLGLLLTSTRPRPWRIFGNEGTDLRSIRWRQSRI